MKSKILLFILILGILFISVNFSGYGNPKLEARNSKQCLNSNVSMLQTLFSCLGHSSFEHSDLFRISDFGFRIYPAYADDVCESWEDCKKEEEEKEEELEGLEEEKEQTESELGSVGEKLGEVESDLVEVGQQLAEKKQEIEAIEGDKLSREELRVQKIALRNQLIRSFYKKGRTSLVELFLASSGLSDLTRTISYYESVVLDGQATIASLGSEIQSLEETLEVEGERKVVLEGEVTTLAVQHQDLETEKGELDAYLGDLTSQISGIEGSLSQINQRQQDLIREKYSATAKFMTVGDWEEEFEALPSAPFDNAFVVISIGYPHRVGMSQYGAYGRAKAGQDYEDILKAYYDNVNIGDYEGPDTIKIYEGGDVRELDFEDNYLRGIAEMPSVWGDKGGMEALKAQAIAARTYALAVTNGGANPICTSQACQVYSSSKASDSRAEDWHRAVEETEGKVITYNGSPIKAWYASTAGGYTRLPTDFDVKWNSTPSYIRRIHDADGYGNAYDGPEYGNSPWYYKAWYSKSHDGHPWLKESELRDLLNAALLLSEDGGYIEHLSQEDPVVSTDSGWSKEEVEEALEDEGVTPIDKVADITVIYSDQGYTSTLLVETSEETVEVDGKLFRKAFVLRSPGYLALWSSLYDIVPD